MGMRMRMELEMVQRMTVRRWEVSGGDSTSKKGPVKPLSAQE